MQHSSTCKTSLKQPCPMHAKQRQAIEAGIHHYIPEDSGRSASQTRQYQQEVSHPWRAVLEACICLRLGHTGAAGPHPKIILSCVLGQVSHPHAVLLPPAHAVPLACHSRSQPRAHPSAQASHSSGAALATRRSLAREGLWRRWESG